MRGINGVKHVALVLKAAFVNMREVLVARNVANALAVFLHEIGRAFL